MKYLKMIFSFIISTYSISSIIYAMPYEIADNSLKIESINSSDAHIKEFVIPQEIIKLSPILSGETVCNYKQHKVHKFNISQDAIKYLLDMLTNKNTEDIYSSLTPQMASEINLIINELLIYVSPKIRNIILDKELENKSFENKINLDAQLKDFKNSSYLTDYLKKYGWSSILNWQDIYPQFHLVPTSLEELYKLDQEEYSKINVIVCSKNQIKLNAAKSIIKSNRRYSNYNLNFTQISAKSDIQEQPLSIENGFLGARNRICNAQKEFKNTDTNNSSDLNIFISIESFFTKPGQDHYEDQRDHAAIVIIDELGVEHNLISDGIILPLDIYLEAKNLSGKSEENDSNLSGLDITLGKILKDRYQLSDSDWQPQVTEEHISRYQQILTCLRGQPSYW